MVGRYTVLSKDSFAWHHHHLTSKNGAIDHAYDGYIEMPKIDHNILGKIWKDKWTNLELFIKDIIYQDFDGGIESFPGLTDAYRNNIYLPYIQDLEY
jgi:hypothetical protein